MFGFPDLLRETDALIDKVDSEIGSASPGQVSQAEVRMRLLRNVRQFTGQITLIIASMFDELVKFENGKDPLTNLLNRHFIPTIMRREIALATSTKKPFTLVMMDVDHFKQVNDRYGHDTGDATLKSISAMIYDHVRSSDYVFRYGGEEFMVLLVETSLRQEKVIVDTLREKVAATAISAFGNQSFSVTLSIDVAEFDYHPDYQQLIDKADSALYQAKSCGRNRVELHS
ncbi:MAG: GGDEF domain-containing protein [Symbiopectobacterium sp.]|uniref:GGDEF domain-containing protein n=1 Tax=Symbiopectobacterium sp. TaxID=2952789 RepID=UPI0039E80DBC